MYASNKTPNNLLKISRDLFYKTEDVVFSYLFLSVYFIIWFNYNKFKKDFYYKK